MIRRTVESIGNAVLDGIGRASSRVQESKPIATDLLESDDEYLAVFDAPGATASDIQVRLDGRTIRIRVDRFREFYEGFEMRFPGRGLSLDGQVRLPDGSAIDPEGASATLTAKGTLEVHVPKDENDGPVRVDADDTSPEPTDDTSTDSHPTSPADIDGPAGTEPSPEDVDDVSSANEGAEEPDEDGSTEGPREEPD